MEDFNPIQNRRKQIADNIAKGFNNDLEKGGEGSRGGHVVGHTKTGKPIYEGGKAKAPAKTEEHPVVDKVLDHILKKYGDFDRDSVGDIVNLDKESAMEYVEEYLDILPESEQAKYITKDNQATPEYTKLVKELRSAYKDKKVHLATVSVAHKKDS